MIFLSLPRPKRAAVVGLAGALLMMRAPHVMADATPVGTTAGAPAPRMAPPETPRPTAADAQKFLALLKMERLCKTPLDLAVRDAVLRDIAARVEKKFPAPSPKIEVRDALDSRLSFDVKNSTVGAALSAAATLAGAQLWVFGDHLLIAPQKSLSVEEQAALKAETGHLWTRNQSQGYGIGKNSSIAFTAMIVEELKTRFSSKNTTLATGKKEPTIKTTFGQLDPDSQQMLQNFVNSLNETTMNHMTGTGLQPFTLSPGTVIELNPASGDFVRNLGGLENIVRLSNASNAIGWSLDMTHFMFKGGGASPLKPTPPSAAPPFLDPSAHNS